MRRLTSSSSNRFQGGLHVPEAGQRAASAPSTLAQTLRQGSYDVPSARDISKPRWRTSRWPRKGPASSRLDMSDACHFAARRIRFPTHACGLHKFHVLRLLNPARPTARRGHRRPTLDDHCRLLLRNGHDLDFWQRSSCNAFDHFTALREVYLAKEALHRLYRTPRVASRTRLRPDARASRGLDPSRAGLATDPLRRRPRSWPTSTPASPTPSPRLQPAGSSYNAELGQQVLPNHRLRLLNACGA